MRRDLEELAAERAVQFWVDIAVRLGRRFDRLNVLWEQLSRRERFAAARAVDRRLDEIADAGRFADQQLDAAMLRLRG